MQQPALSVMTAPWAISLHIATPVNGGSCIFCDPITFHVVDNGGGASTGGGYMLNSTISQPDAGAMTGGGYTLVGGFWGGAYQAQRRGTSICSSSCAKKNCVRRTSQSGCVACTRR